MSLYSSGTSSPVYSKSLHNVENSSKTIINENVLDGAIIEDFKEHKDIDPCNFIPRRHVKRDGRLVPLNKRTKTIEELMSERDKDIEKVLFDGEQPDIFIAKKTRRHIYERTNSRK